VTLSRADTLRLAAESLTDVRTVRAVYEGRPTRPTSRERVKAAAERLGIAWVEKRRRK